MSSERFAKAGELFDSALAMPPENRARLLVAITSESLRSIREAKTSIQ